MTGNVQKFVLLDTGVWIGLLDQKDSHHKKARELFESIESLHGIVPWPTLYELMNTKSTKNVGGLARLRAELRSPGIVKLPDEPYRELALEACTAAADARRRPLSLVDRVLRAMASDPDVRVHAIATFNPGDFADVCRDRQLDLLGS